MEVSEHHLDPALVRDLESRLGVTALLDWLEEQAEVLAELGYEAGSGVRFSAALSKARNIVKISAGTVIGEHARIVPGAKGYVVYFRKDLPQDRIRFSIAHEIGHTFLFDTNDLGKPISPLQSNVSGAATVECLCDYFAGALLLPRQRLVDAVAKDGLMTVPPLHLVPTLAQEYQVADQAVARRLLFQLFPQRVAILRIRRHTTVTKKTTGRGEWSISWCAVPWDLRMAHSMTGVRVPFLNKGRAIPDDMVPTLRTARTERCELDGRWWEGISAQGAKESRVTFSSRPPKATREAFAFKIRLHRSLPLFEQFESRGLTYTESESPEPEAKEFMYLALPLPTKH
jgi:IrrE N-terminal-like domain